MAYDQIAANIAREIEQLRDERDQLRQALEIIAVGDSRDPRADAAEALRAIGFWKPEPAAGVAPCEAPNWAEVAQWLHAAYDRPPQTPEVKAMLARVDAAAAGVMVDADARDAARFRHLQKGLPLTVVVPTPTDEKPNKKVTVNYGPNPEPAWGDALARAVDAASGVKTPPAAKLENFLAMVRVWVERDGGDMDKALAWMHSDGVTPTREGQQ